MSRRSLLLIVIVLSTLVCCQLVCLGGLDEDRFAGRLDLDALSFEQVRQRFTTRLSVNQIHLVSGKQNGCDLTSTRLIVPMDQTCIYALEADHGATRQLSLVLGGDAVSAHLVLTQPNAFSIEQTLVAGQSIEMDIYKNDENQDAELSIEDCMLVPISQGKDSNPGYVCMLEIEQ